MSDLLLPDRDAQRLRFEWEWAKLGREWWNLIELSADAAAMAEEAMADMRELVGRAKTAIAGLRGAGVLPPKGTS